MGELKGKKELFAGRHVDREIIVLCVCWYLHYKLSLRDLVELMAERGLDIAHTTIMRWGTEICSGVREALEWLCTEERSLMAR